MEVANFLKILRFDVTYQNSTPMDIVMWILYGGRGPTTTSFIYSTMVLFGIMNLYLFLKCTPSNL